MRDLLLLLAMAFGAIVLGAALAGGSSGMVFGISVYQSGGVVSIAAILALLGGLLWFATLYLGAATISAFFWGLIGIALLVFFSGNIGLFNLN